MTQQDNGEAAAIRGIMMRTEMTLTWTIHDDGYMWTQGRKGRYEISEGYGAQRGMMRMNVNGRVAYFTGVDSAKDFAQEMEE